MTRTDPAHLSLAVDPFDRDVIWLHIAGVGPVDLTRSELERLMVRGAEVLHELAGQPTGSPPAWYVQVAQALARGTEAFR